MRPRSDAELVSLGVVGGLVLLVFCLAEPARETAAAPMPRLPVSPLPTPPLATALHPGSLSPPPVVLAEMDLLFPVPAVSSKGVPDSFADRRGERVHHALDILAPRHSEVVAVADGTIARLMTSVAGGIAVYQFSVDHRFSFYYAHLQGYANGLVEGQQVRRGQVLGYVGTSGNAPPNTPHLHFAISRVERPNQWSGGPPLNPYPLWR